MNEEDLEQRLAALRPAELPGELQAALASPPAKRNKIRWLYAAGPLAAAACWLLVMAQERPAPPDVPSKPGPQPSDYHVFFPVEQKSRLVSLEDLTILDADSAEPTKLVRATWIDDVTYAGDDGHSKIRRRETRAEIIPVALQAY
jgi:hypothetical protein